MKRYLFLVLILLSGMNIFSQTDSSAKYWKNKAIPAFTLLNLDSTKFNNAQMKPGKATIIMLFNPECEHCQDQFKLLVSIAEVTQAQVILTATETMDKIKIFNKKFEVAKYPFVHIARDDHFTFGPIYQPKTIPVLVFYNKQGHFVGIKQGEANKKEIVNWLTMY